MSEMKDLAKQHLALLVSGLLVGLASLKILYVSRFDLNTARLVLGVADRITILVSTLFLVYALLAAVAASNPRLRYLVWAAGNKDGAKTWQVYFTWLVGVPLYGVLLMVLSIPLVLGIGVGQLIAWALRARYRKRSGRTKATTIPVSDTNYHWIRGATATLVLMALLTTPWTPAERLTLSSGETAVGLVIGEQLDQTLILERGMGARWVSTDAIDHRDLCRTEPTIWSSLGKHIGPKAGVDCQVAGGESDT